MEFMSQDIVRKLEEMAPTMGVDPKLARAIFIAENSKDGEWNPQRKVRLDTKSPAGAFGVMQVMPQTHAGLIRTGYLPPNNRLSTLEEQIAAGLAAIKEAQDTVRSTDPTDTAVRYNASIGAYQNWKKTGVLPAETSHYITKVARAMGNEPMTGDVIVPSGGASTSTGASGVTPPTGLMQQGVGVNAMAGQLLELMRAITGESMKAADSVKELLDKKVGGTMAAASAKTDAANAEEEQKRRLLNVAGGDLTNPDSIISKAQSDAVAAAQRSSNLEAEITKLQSINPLEDPLGWFVGQIKLNALGKEWQVARETEQRAQNTISGIQQRVDAQSKIQPALLADLRVKALQGEKDAATAEAAIQALEVESRVRQERQNLVRTELMIVGDNFQRSVAMARMMQDYEQDVARRSERDGKKADLIRANDVVQKYGLRPFLSEADRKAYGAEAEARIARAAVTGGGMGSSPGEVAANMQLFGNLAEVRKTNPVLAATITSLQQAGRARIDAAMRNVASPEYAQISKMTPADRLEWGVNKQWEEWRAEAGKKSMDQLKGDNPFKLNAEAAAAAPELANNGFAKYVTDRMKAGGKVPDEKELISAAIGFMQADPPKPPEVVVRELHDFFTKGVKHQATLYGWGLMGADLSDPDPKNKGGEFRYRVSPAVFGSSSGWFSSGPVEKDLNVMNLGELQNLIQKARKQQAAAANTQGLLSAPLFDLAFGQPNISPLEQQRQNSLAAQAAARRTQQ